MGWNSWNKFACEIDERLIRETADAMVKQGLKDAGFQYVTLTIAAKANVTPTATSSPTPSASHPA